MIYFVSLMAHAATAYLHLLLAWRFYPKRQDNYFVQLFWYLMLLSLSLHVVYGSFYVAVIFEHGNVKPYIKALGYALLVFYPAILATLFLGELKVKPSASSRMVDILSLISRDTRILFMASLGGALFTLIIPVLIEQSFDIHRYSFGNRYAFAFILVFSFLWLIMYLAGLRAIRQNTQINSTRFGYVFAIIILLLLSGLTFLTDVQHAWNFTPIISTIGLSLSFCWYRFRTQFMDVILNQFFRIAMLVTIAIGFRYFIDWLEFQNYSTEVDLIMIFTVMLITIYLFYGVNHLLKSLWQPKSQLLAAIHRELPVLLNECTTNEGAIRKTEQYLSHLFSTQVSVNQPLANTVQVVTIEGDPELRLHLNYMRNWMPWFSEALNWVQIAGLYLQSHLKVIDALAKEHIQKLNAQEFAKLAAKAELMAMQAQIRPHFLFNCLNSIHAFITYSPAKAEQMIESLANLIRGVLRMSDKDVVALSQELELVNDYIFIEKMRYGDNFEFQLVVENGCEQLLVPSFSIQPLVENAIKHAVDQQFEPVSIKVDVSKHPRYLLIEVSDDGPGLSNHHAVGLGMAMQNIENRLKNLYGDLGTLTLKNAEIKGAVAVLQIPI